MANAGSFKKGEKRPNQGKRGPNKMTKALREMILQALDEQPGGGVAYLKIQAAENPNAFMSLLGKVLPMQVTGEGGGPIQTETTWVIQPVKSRAGTEDS